jgi:hypothetical protein
MSDALEVLESLESLNIEQAAIEAFQEHKGRYLILNKEQLLEGKLSTGQDLHPLYFNDPFFKTPEAAKRYSDWKDKITPHSKRKKGVPNLYIIGTYHGSIQLEIVGNEYELHSEYKDAASIESKFTNNIYGLNEEKAEEFIEDGMEETFYGKIHEQTGL